VQIYYNSAVKSNRQRVGQIGEEVASQFLERKGFKVVERNYRKPWGEIDIVVEKGEEVRFVEVKTVTRETSSGVTREIDAYSPEEMAHAAKLRKVARTAELYMESRNDHRDFQIDVVTVILDEHTRQARCRHYEQVM
jgi:putative endonuclease